MREESTNPCAWHEPGYYPACPPWSRDVEVRDDSALLQLADEPLRLLALAVQPRALVRHDKRDMRFDL